ncbi:MAG: hypothetical protein WCX48_06105 [Bacteroidales bacterium]
MEADTIIQIITASIAVISLVLNFCLVKKTTSSQLLHSANKDWFNTFINLIGELSSLHSRICSLRKSAPDEFCDAKTEIKLLIRSKLSIMRILLDKDNTKKDLDGELIKMIDKYFIDIDSAAPFDCVPLIIKDLDKIIRKATEISEVAKTKLYNIT